MIVKECLYDPCKDLKPVDSFGWLDVAEAYVNKSVPSDIVTQETDFNNIDDPSSILGKPTDVFHALRMQDSIEASVSAQNDKPSE